MPLPAHFRHHPHLSLPCAFGLLATLFATGCGQRGDGAAPGQGEPSGPRAFQVRVEPAQLRDIVYAVEAPGSLEAEQVVQVVAQVEGSVTEVRFDEGDRVSPETVLARIDPQRYELSARRARATYESSQADLRRAEAELERREELARAELLSLEELTRAREEVESLRAIVNQRKAESDLAEQDHERSTVRPPIAGEINRREVAVGQYVQPGDMLATLVNTQKLRLRFKVSEAESVQLREGEQVRFKVPALGPQDFAASIYHVSEGADPATRQVEILAWVQNPGQQIKPGFFVQVRAEVESHQRAVVIPERGVQATEKGFVVFTAVDGKAKSNTVQVGLRDKDGWVEILAGLEGGAAVVVEGGEVLRDGAPIAVEERSS
ncbi:MAG TPA: efflux RND transporter periplasmic adaptor subunit [Acidobacteriota bacterium]